MRRIVCLLVLTTGSFAADDGVRWETSLRKGRQAARKSGKPVLALFWADW
jgi:hypothetical protein